MLSARLSSNACSIGKCRDQLTRTPATASPIFPTPPAHAARRRMARVTAAVAVLVCALGGLPAGAGGRGLSAARTASESAAPQAEQSAARPAGEPGAESAARPGGQGGESAHGGEGEAARAESIWAVLGRLFNFAVLAGALVYFLRSPLMAYLDDRRVQVRSALTKAAELKAEAGAEMSAIDARLGALPGELEALKRRGAEEIAAEESRIRAQAEAERQRLLDQAKREIATELRVAERDLKKRAAELAVSIATERVKGAITDADQARLVDRYVAQVKE
jgi:F-type H+-transporting ATPase subunit b